MDEIPETWDTVKRKNPIHPTCSRGKFGEVLFCNEKYHCYGVKHSTPTYNLMPYQPEGFGYAERAMKYIHWSTFTIEVVHRRRQRDFWTNLSWGKCTRTRSTQLEENETKLQCQSRQFVRKIAYVTNFAINLPISRIRQMSSSVEPDTAVTV